jgi:Protein of unknown function (DUF3383)
MPTLAGQMQTAGASTAAVLTGGATAAGAPQTALLSNLTANNAAGFNIAINNLNREIGPIDFTGAASLTVCATRINAAIAGAGAGCVWTTDHFAITTTTVGPAATLTYATPPSGPTVEADVSSILLLTTGTAASLAQGSQGALNVQWKPCNGGFYYGYAMVAARPHAAPSQGTYRDYWRRNMGFARTRGVGGFMIGVPYDPAATYYVSLADDSSETTLVTPPTVQKPPAGVR